MLPLSGGDPARAIGLAGMMAVVAGLVLILSGVLRLGFVTELLSKPIRYGYMNGIALTVIVSQIPNLFQVSIDSTGPIHDLLGIAKAVLNGEANWTAFGIGAGTLAVILVSKRWPRFPGILLAVIVATVAVGLLGLGETAGVKVLGPLPEGLPHSRSRRSSRVTLFRSSSAVAPSRWCPLPIPACCRAPTQLGCTRPSMPTRK